MSSHRLPEAQDRTAAPRLPPHSKLDLTATLDSANSPGNETPPAASSQPPTITGTCASCGENHERWTCRFRDAT
ncbi:Hypothetical predicted protein [Podarcis lilfordi]|uniref:Uncharacterized protein n=1 Tax=Podarcis lilfordi TaxID=74358 RepID=A0AA35L7H5_9SAUR|nr:Hypothetical predicted protein [Podarcis lilfordi]